MAAASAAISARRRGALHQSFAQRASCGDARPRPLVVNVGAGEEITDTLTNETAHLFELPPVAQLPLLHTYASFGSAPSSRPLRRARRRSATG